MAMPIIPRFVRGRLFYQVSEVLFPHFRDIAHEDVIATDVRRAVSVIGDALLVTP